jgi:ubiquinone/menaquinone biosynthesis C-methylase UbiE
MIKSEKLWDRMAKIYDDSTKKFDHLHNNVVENAMKFLKSNDTVLDCGCGTGKMTLDIANRVKKIQAIDISSKMLEIAKRKAHDLGINNISFSHTTMFDENLTKEKFDVILAFNVLHYFKDIKKNITRINELLKPKGMFISLTPCSIEKNTISSYFFATLISLLVMVRILPYIKLYRYSDLNGVITNGNFQIIESEKLHGPEEHYFVIAQKI